MFFKKYRINQLNIELAKAEAKLRKMSEFIDRCEGEVPGTWVHSTLNLTGLVASLEKKIELLEKTNDTTTTNDD